MNKEQQEYYKLVSKCRNDILFFVNNLIIEPYNVATGANYFITTQQKQGLTALRDLVLDKIAGKRHDVLGISIMSGRGCHAEGTPIMMEYGGCRKVENIQVGDKLMGDDGTPREVLELKRGREQMYRIHVSDGSYYDVNKSHILSLRCCETGQRGSLKSGDILNITVEEYLTWSDRKKRSYSGYKVPVNFDKQSVRIPAYILGIWLGDGDSDSARLINTDKSVIDEWKIYGESLGLKYRVYNKIDHRVTGEGNGKRNKFLDLLREYNLINNKHIPSDYIFNDRETRLALLAGLIDTDGCVRKKGAYGISTKYKSFAEQITYLARSLGFRVSLKEVKESGRNLRRNFKLNI
jgi:replicative DNA helicase